MCSHKLANDSFVDTFSETPIQGDKKFCVRLLCSNVSRGRVKTFPRTTGKHCVHPDQRTFFVHAWFR